MVGLLGGGGGEYQEAWRLCVVQRSATSGTRQFLLVLDDRGSQVGTPRIPLDRSLERPPRRVGAAHSCYRGRHLWAGGPVGEATRRSVDGRERPRNEGIHRHRSKMFRSLLRTAASHVQASHRTL